jgi:hypothetical protein
LGNKDEGDGSDGENQSPFLTGMKEMEGMGRTKALVLGNRDEGDERDGKEWKQLLKGVVYPLNPLYP